MAVARYRDRHTVARSKSDHADAVVLANILRSLLREYYPAFLDAFSNRKDFLVSADARAV